MLKKISALVAGVAFLLVVGGVVYADTCGMFSQNDNAAKQLVDKYMSFVMKNYTPDGNKVSFRGIIKQGCDFWYYNDYSCKTIAINHAKDSDLSVESADYSIDYNSITYSNKEYTVTATVTERVQYKNYSEPVECVREHIFTIEQHGSEMYITNDLMNPRMDLSTMMPKHSVSEDVPQTADNPK